MPETRFTVQWPNGETEQCYSPSTVIHDYLRAQTSYPLNDFLSRTRQALEQASQRVEAKYGFRCSSADAQLSAIERKATAFKHPAEVICLSIA